MSTTPTTKNQSFGLVRGQGANLVAGTRDAKMMIRVGSAITPVAGDDNQAYTDGSFLVRGAGITIAWALATAKTGGVGDDTGNIGGGFWVFEDNADGAGIGTGNVQYVDASPQAVRTFANGAFAVVVSGTTTVTFAKSGTYKLVPVIYSLVGLTVDAANPPTTARVRNTAVAETDFYVDSDNNSAFSFDTGDDPAIKNFNTGRSCWARVACDPQTLSSSLASPLRYTKSPTLTLDANASTFAGTSTKQMRIGFVDNNPSAPSTTAPGKTQTLTMTLNGASVTSAVGANNIDTDFSSTDETYRLRAFVGPRGGQSSTPAGEKPNLLGAGTLTLVDTNDQAWTVFASSGLGAGISQMDAYAVQNTSDFTIGSGISATCSSFSSTGRTIAQDLFKRTGPTVTTDAVPFLRGEIRDAGNALLATVSFVTTIRTQNASPVVDVTLGAASTTAGGILDQNFTVPAASAAFSRYPKTGATRAAGSHATTGPDSVASPPATFSAAPGAVLPPPFPAYPKTVRYTGNAYAGVKEPFADVTSVFGVNSEIFFEDIWTGTLTASAMNGNGVPTGAGQREQQLGAGSLRAKLTTEINEGTGKIINLGEVNGKDVAGRGLVVTTDFLFLRRALWDDTNDVASDAGTSLNDAQTRLENALGYHTSNPSLDSIAPPADPSSLIYYQGAADTTAQRATLSLTASGSDPDIGFTGDAGNFGYRAQPVSFIALDSTIKLILNAESVQTDPTLIRRYTVKVIRVTADDDFVDVDTDAAPIWVAYAQPATGAMSEVARGTAVSIGGSGSNYEFTVTMPTGYDSLKVFSVAKVNGSRTIGGDVFTQQLGYAFDAVDFAVGFPFK